MRLTTNDFLKKAVLESQERVRDYMRYAEEAENPSLKKHFRAFAKETAEQAVILQNYLE